MTSNNDHHRECSTQASIQVLTAHVLSITVEIAEPVLQSSLRQLPLDGSLPQTAISHLDLLQEPPYDDTEVLTISKSCKRNTTHQKEDEIEVLSRNLLNISFSSSDPKPLSWDLRDPLLIH